MIEKHVSFHACYFVTKSTISFLREIFQHHILPSVITFLAHFSIVDFYSS